VFAFLEHHLDFQAVLPHAQLNSTDHLSEHDLNALIAHAHVKIDLLRRHLTEQQVFKIILSTFWNFSIGPRRTSHCGRHRPAAR
jgi:hypothetical protein